MATSTRPGSDGRTAPAERAERLRRSERRDQLLDTAASLVAEGGFEAVTMEGVAARAGVSKALPYVHFENADALVVALRDRELAIVTRRVVEATLSEQGFEEKIAAAVHVCFETFKERGRIIASFLRWLPQFEMKVHARPAPPSPFDWFLADLFEKELGLPRTVARVAQRVFGMGVIGAIDAWTEGYAKESTAERSFVRMVIGGIQALAADEKLGTRRAARR